MQQDANHTAEEKSTRWFSWCLRLASALAAAGLTWILLPHLFSFLAQHPHPLLTDITCRETGNSEDIYWKINQIFISSGSGQHAGEIFFTHSVPNFTSYYVKTGNSAAWKKLDGNRLCLPEGQQGSIFYVKAANRLGGETAVFGFQAAVQGGKLLISPQPSTQPLQSIPFRFETHNAPGMAALREKCASAAAAGNNEWSRFIALRKWVRTLIPFGTPLRDSNWSTADILQALQENKNVAFLCDEFAAVFVSACISSGLNARIVHLSSEQGAGHYAAEVWSDERQQWLFMDPLYEFSLCEGADCYSALDLHNLFLRSGTSPSVAKQFPDSKYLSLFYELQFIMANDFLSHPYDSVRDIISGRIKTLRWIDAETPRLNKLKAGAQIALFYYIPRIGLRLITPYSGIPCFLALSLLFCCVIITTKKKPAPAKNPRILMIVSLFHPHLGGAEQQALILAEQLIKEGLCVSVLTRSFKNLASFEVIQGVPVYRRIRTLPWGKWFGLSYILSVLWFLLRKKSSYDIIHCHLLSFHSAVAVLFQRLFNKKTISLVGATGPISDFLQMKNVFLGEFFLRLIARSDRLILLCEKSREEALDEGISPEQLVYIPNGVDTTYFKPVPETGTKKKNIIFIGRLDYLKGVDVLLQALRSLIDARIPAHLDILGDGPERNKLELLSQQLGIAAVVTFHGAVHGVAPYLQRSALFVLPSLSEGMPNVVLEAMACGLPVVATRVGGIVDIIDNGKNGLLVDAQRPDQLYEAMKQLLTNKELTQRLGMAARKTMEERFSLPVIVNRYSNLYQELTDSR